MIYKHRYKVKAPLSKVIEFHSLASSMMTITPPPMRGKIFDAPHQIAPGDQIAFRMWLGPIPIYWKAMIEETSNSGFVDHQLEGPFQEWRHRHDFIELGDQMTEVYDEVHASLRPHLIWGLLGLVMWLGLPVLFAYRSWKTRSLLEINY